MAERAVQKRSNETRQAILLAALAEFARLGFDGASTRWIAEKAGVNHNLIRHHFGSKEDLWKATARYAFDRYWQRIDKQFADLEGSDQAETSRMFLKEFVLFSAEVPEFNRFMMQANQGDASRLRWLVDEFLGEGSRYEVQMLQIAQSFGEFAAGDAVHLRYLFIGAATSIFTFATEFSELTGEDPFSEQVIENHIDVVLRLFSGEQG